MGATREIDEDVNRTNAADAPQGAIRLHLQHQWPRIYPNLQTAIGALMARQPLRYWMEEKVGTGWITVISLAESQQKLDYIGDDRS
jgi:hypothetical protein